MILFEITQISRKEYAIIGSGTYLEPVYETLFDSKGGSHKVEVERVEKTFSSTVDDCEITMTLSDDNCVLGDDWNNFKLYYPIRKIADFTCMPERFIATHLHNGIDSTVLKRQFEYSLFYGKDSFLDKEAKFKGLHYLSDGSCALSGLKEIAVGERSRVRLWSFSIDKQALFQFWWTPEVRNALKKVEYDYPQIYDIDDGITAATTLFEIRSKMKKKMIVKYEW